MPYKKVFIMSFVLVLTIYFILYKLISELQLIQYNPRKYNYNLAFKSLLLNPNEIILRYVSLPYDYAFGSQLIPLVVASFLSDGDLLELGMGFYSTPVLHKLAVDKEKIAFSIETNAEWAQKFEFYKETSTHQMHVMSFDEMTNFELDKSWGVVLVDHGFANKRFISILKYANKSQIILAHDAEDAAELFYEYKHFKIREHFKYSCRYSLFHQNNRSLSDHTSTLLLSNFIDVSRFEKIFKNIKTDYGYKFD